MTIKKWSLEGAILREGRGGDREWEQDTSSGSGPQETDEKSIGEIGGA